MAGRGPTPKRQRRNKSDKPIRGEWQATDAAGWQHGPIPAAPDGLLEISRETWLTWFSSWFAAHWGTEIVPDVQTTILLFDQVRRGEYQRAAELRMWEDNCGITPKGQQDRRWTRPKGEEEQKPSSPQPNDESPDQYGHLRAV